MSTNIPISLFVKSDLLVLEEGITAQKCNFFKNQILLQLRKLVKQRPGDITLNWETELAEVAKLYDMMAEKFIAATDIKYPPIKGTEPFNPNKYLRDLLPINSIQYQINNGATLKLDSIFYTIKHNLQMAFEDYDKRIEYIKLWDLASKLKMIHEPTTPPINLIYRTLLTLPSPDNSYSTGVSYLKDLLDNNISSSNKDIIQKVMEWMVDKSDCKFDMIYSGNGIDIVRPLDSLSYLKFGFGTQWCTSIPSLQSGILHTRGIKITTVEDVKKQLIESTAEYPDAITVIKNDKPIYQIDIESHQYMNVNDDDFLTTIKRLSFQEIEDERERCIKALVNFVNDLDFKKIAYYFESSELADDVLDEIFLSYGTYEHKRFLRSEFIIPYSITSSLYLYKPDIPLDADIVEAFKAIGMVQSIKDVIDYDKMVKELLNYVDDAKKYFHDHFEKPNSNVIRTRDWIMKTLNVYNSPMKDDAIHWLEKLGRNYDETHNSEDLYNDIPDID